MTTEKRGGKIKNFCHILAFGMFKLTRKEGIMQSRSSDGNGITSHK